jgi:hypothetical protein
MNNMKSIISFAILFFVVFNAYSQGCKNYHLKTCEGCGDPFKYSGQSKSAMMEKGQTSTFHIVVYEGFEYCVQISAAKNLKGISFRILEDNPAKTVLYDSSVEGNSYLEKGFYATRSRKLLIEVSVPASNIDVTQESYDELHGCVGVLIEYNHPPKKGFEEK